MRVAISGAHRNGKTTLIEELRRALPTYEAMDEPYRLLEEDGHAFAAMPSLEDFELQLERSIECVSSGKKDQLFDRCPADILAYLVSHPDSDGFDLEHWLPRARGAMRHLELVVFVPVEPDRAMDTGRTDRLRGRVDEELREILLEDRWDFGVEVLEVAGSPIERARQVLEHINGKRPSPASPQSAPPPTPTPRRTDAPPDRYP
jgi:predicted ATPase